MKKRGSGGGSQGHPITHGALENKMEVLLLSGIPHPASFLSQVQFPWYDPCRALHLAAARTRSSGRILPWTAVCQCGRNRRSGITPGALTVGTLPSRAGTAPGLPGTQFFSNETHLRLPGHMMRSSRRETGQALRRGCPVCTTYSNTRSFQPAAVPALRTVTTHSRLCLLVSLGS